MKAPAFWARRRGVLSTVLTPLSWLYRAGGVARRVMAQPYQAKIPVICVGNITAGGSGKTPVALALAEILIAAGHKPFFVTRGYGGSERGPLRVDPQNHNATQVGDEALLLAQVAPTIVTRDRAAGIRLAERDATHIILDDGLQNPNVKPALGLLVIDAAAGFGNGCIIPAGPLRETLDMALQRVGAVVMIGEGQNIRIESKPVLHAKLIPQLPPDFPHEQNFLAFAGIGRPEKFYDTARAAGLNLVATQDFPDHHPFTSAELIALVERAAELGAVLLTTEKDAIRLPPELRMQVEILPVKLVFDDAAAMAGKILSLC